jgi:menaquinone-specific isochorismate synthase
VQLEKFLQEGTLISIERDTLLVGWGERHWKEYPEPDVPSFYFPDFFLENPKAWFTHAETCVISLSDFMKQFEIKTSIQTIRWQLPKWDAYDEEYHSLKKSFQNRVLAKAVLYVFEHAQISFDTSTLLHWLKHAINFLSAQEAHVYGFWSQSQGMLGVTPELLFKVIENPAFCVETLACAGTSHAGNRGCDILNDPKERYEHDLVIQGITQALNAFGTVQEGQSTLQAFGSLSHIVTPLKVYLTAKPSFTSLVEALHPTPALGAYPKENGKIWLKEYEQKMPRGRYGAPVGYHLPKEGKNGCLVAIRNVQWDSKSNKTVLSLGAGSGIVSGSQLANEREEVKRKIEAIKKILGLDADLF